MPKLRSTYDGYRIYKTYACAAHVHFFALTFDVGSVTCTREQNQGQDQLVQKME